MSLEIWKPVPNFEGYFEVSNQGRVRTVERKVRFVSKRGCESWRVKARKIISQQLINSGYMVVHLQKDGVRHAKTVHSVVAMAFLGERPCGLDVCHNNGVKTDNRSVNIRYDTRRNNHADKVLHGTVYAGATQAKITAKDAAIIRKIANDNLMGKKELAAMYGVTSETIRRVLKNETWKYAS